MTEQLIREGLLGVGLPLVVAGAILALAWRVWRARAGSPAAHSSAWAGALAFGAAMIASHIALNGGVNQKWERVVYLLIAAGVIGMAAAAARWTLTQRAKHAATTTSESVCAGARPGDWLAWVIAAMLTGAAAHFVMAGIFQDGDPTWMRIAAAGAPVAFALIMQPLAQRRPGATLPAALTLACFGQAGVLVLSGNQTFALIPASLAAASMAAVLVGGAVALRGGSVSIGSGAMPLASVALTIPPVLGLLWVTGLPIAFAWAAGLVAFAPAMLWIGEVGSIARRGALTRFLIRLALVALPIAAGLLLAKANAETDVYFG
ncbi:MAG: hypothetical protein HRU76_05355 [Phycisphaeraceae bacterium]|nr:MAG: hypothetical protein HRU76_05355 [Phycisphaeraceae bacterium]